MLTPKTDFLGTGPIIYVCEIVFGLQETPIFFHNLSCVLLTIYAILSLKAITLAPGKNIKKEETKVYSVNQG